MIQLETEAGLEQNAAIDSIMKNINKKASEGPYDLDPNSGAMYYDGDWTGAKARAAAI